MCLCGYKHNIMCPFMVNSYIHELIYFMLTRFHLWFWNILVINNRWLQIALIVLAPSCINFQSGFVSSSNNVLDGSLDGDVFFRSNSSHTLHSFTNLISNVVISVTYWIAWHMHAAIQVVYSHYMLTPSLEHLWYVKFLTSLFKQEDQ